MTRPSDRLQLRIGSNRARRIAIWSLLGIFSVFACAAPDAPTAKKKRTPVDVGDDYFGDEPEEKALTPIENVDSGVFGAGSRPKPQTDAGTLTPEAEAGPVDSKTFCNGPLQAGDLRIVELLIASRSGSGDEGEWIEVRSTRNCWLDLNGLSIGSPRGGAPANVITISGSFELEPGGSFVVADSADPLKNNSLSGRILSWSASDVLKNDGDTVSLGIDSTVVDTLTYPSFTNLEVGRSIAFPADCSSWDDQADWSRWSLSFASWSWGFSGTPNAANDDVACY